jgi:hypothetical protein
MPDLAVVIDGETSQRYPVQVRLDSEMRFLPAPGGV